MLAGDCVWWQWAFMSAHTGWRTLVDRVHVCKLARNDFAGHCAFVCASWLEVTLNCTGHSFLHAGWQIDLDRIEYYFLQAGRQLFWIAVGSHSCKMFGDRFELHWVFMSACCPANRFGSNRAVVSAGWAKIALDRIGRSVLQNVRPLL
jgi:hypothetical protein